MEKGGVGKIKNFFRRFWYLLWKDDSFKGWIFSIVIIFIFIKFIFFPSLNFLTGTSLPLAIVESCSMYHEGNLLSDFDEWWERNEMKYSSLELNKEEFKDFSFKSGLNKGDILFITGISSEKIKLGDVIIFSANQKNPLIHRVVEIEERNGELIFSTMGDNNERQLISEKDIREDQILGKARLKIAPYLGWVKLIFFEFQRDENGRGFCEEI